MALFSLSPANANSLVEITPKNWHRYPTPITAANIKPEYVPVFTYNGGVQGDETVAETNVVVDDRGVGDYGPRNLTEKMAWPGVPNSVVPSESTSSGQVITSIADYTQSADITAPRGWIEPDDPYRAPPVSPTDDPTITSLAPNTGVSGAGKAPTWVTITGTKFTQWSTVETGGVLTPYFKYVSPTRIDMLQDPRSSPGTVVVKVIDHGVKSAGSNFTFT